MAYWIQNWPEFKPQELAGGGTYNVSASFLLQICQEELTDTFRRELEAANLQIGLRDVEIDLAVAGFQEVLQAVIYHQSA